MIRHVVLLKLTDPGLAPETVDRLQALVGHIPSLRTLEAGVDVLRSDASYDVSLVTTHDDLAAMKAYADHPAHQEFLRWIRPHLAARAVADSES